MKNASGTRARSSRGISIIAVISMLVLIAAAIASLSVLFATENRLTKTTITGTQLRQLLLASTPCAADELRRHGPAAPRRFPGRSDS